MNGTWGRILDVRHHIVDEQSKNQRYINFNIFNLLIHKAFLTCMFKILFFQFGLIIILIKMLTSCIVFVFLLLLSQLIGPGFLH